MALKQFHLNAASQQYCNSLPLPNFPGTYFGKKSRLVTTGFLSMLMFFYLLYILPIVWVLRTPNTSQNLLFPCFQMFFQVFDAKMKKNAAKRVFWGAFSLMLSSSVPHPVGEGLCNGEYGICLIL